MNNLDIYNKLRDMHNILKDIRIKTNNEWAMPNWEMNAIEAVDSVLYLAESVFSEDKEVKKVK